MRSTIAEALASATSRLSASPAARSDAEELVSRLLGLTRSELLLERQRELTPEHWRTLDAWLRRRALGEPVQLITGRAAFRSLDLAVAPGVLIPRPETEGLVEAVLGVLRAERGRWPRPRVLDLGTGSGAIALAIASEWPQAIVTATDRSHAALAIARSNVAAHGLASRVELRDGDWFDALLEDERFEAIVANPPYIADGERGRLPEDVRDFEPEEALFSGSTGLEDLREIVDGAPRHLITDGLLALELAEMRAQEVVAWLEGAHDWTSVELRDDLAGRPRVLLARRQTGPAIAPAQWGEER
jgi:release factor glutamine methyltransferase